MMCVFRFITQQLPVYGTPYYFTHDSQVEMFCCIFLWNYNTRISEIRFQGKYKSATLSDAFSYSSLNNFLFTEIFELGYHQ